MNSYYAESPTMRMPDIIEVFANPWLKELADAFLTNPDKMNWLRSLQQEGFQINLPPDLKERFVGILSPILNDNFTNGAGPAFSQMCSQLRDSVRFNTARLPEARRFGSKVEVIWGSLDPYLTPDAAGAIGGNFAQGTIKLVIRQRPDYSSQSALLNQVRRETSEIDSTRSLSGAGSI